MSRLLESIVSPISLGRRLVAPFALLAAALACAPTAAARPTEWRLSTVDTVPVGDTAEAWDSVYVDWYDGGQPDWNTAIRLTVERRGEVVAENSSPSPYWSYLSLPELRPGDVITASTTPGLGKIARHVYDGNPALDPDVCDGATAVTGTVAAGWSMSEIFSFRWKLTTGVYYPPEPEYPEYPNYPGYPGYPPYPVDPPGAPVEYSYWEAAEYLTGAVTSLGGGRFGAEFTSPLAAGRVVAMSAYRVASPTLSVEQYRQQLLGSCPSPGGSGPPPAPPAPPTPPAPPAPLAGDTTPPTGQLAKLTAKQRRQLTRARLFSRGLTVRVTPSEAGSVTGQLIVRRGKASRKAKTRLLAASTKSALAGKGLSLTLRPKPAMRRHLSGLPAGSKLLLRISITDAAGNTTQLRDVQLAIPRP